MNAIAIPDVTAVVTFHREDTLAHITLLSIERCRKYAERAGASVELVLALDNANTETRRIVAGHPAVRDTDRIIEHSCGDPAESRNRGIAASRGLYVSVFDGDDLFSENWIGDALAMAASETQETLLHPELNVVFGAHHAFWWQPDQLGPYYRPEYMFSLNFWNTCVFARRSVFDAHPYQHAGRGESGFGYEDWHWNLETLSSGHVHRVVPMTLRMERRKTSGSMNAIHDSASAVTRPSAFFEAMENFRGP